MLRFEKITNNTNKAFHEKTSQYLSDLQENRTSLKKTLDLINEKGDTMFKQILE